MDVIGRDEPVRRSLPPWLADRRVAAVAAAALLTAAAGAVAVARIGSSAPAPGEVGVVFDGGESAPSGDGASGVLQLQVVNR
ncbi:MAG: hypothetical protein KY442_11295, partial [Proteobacteria bacterium]|nr:hypothetical protein [Pseudomonadota bacterium]